MHSNFNEYRKVRFGGEVDPVKKSIPAFQGKLAVTSNKDWIKRAQAEYGLANPTPEPVHQEELKANVELIKPQGIPGSNFTGPIIPAFMEALMSTEKTDNDTKFKVNKYGWADIDHYRKKKDDSYAGVSSNKKAERDDNYFIHNITKKFFLTKYFN